MFCRYCGNEIPDDSAFCQHCGRRLGVSQMTADTTPKYWEYMTVVINFRKGEAGWVAEEAYTAPVAQQSFWNDAQPLIQDIKTMAADEGWQPLGEHGPACVELDRYKSTEGRSRVLMAASAVATYGSSLLFARSWKWTARSITLRWRRPTTREDASERIAHLWHNAKSGEWEAWELDKATNKWVLMDQAGSREYSRSGQLSSVVQKPALAPVADRRGPQLTEVEMTILRLLAEDLSDEEIANQLGTPGLDVNMMALRLCRKLDAKSKAQLIQRAKEMDLIARDAKY